MTDRGSGKYEDGASNPARQPSFFSELRKRRVFRAGAAYAVIAWGVTEILDGVISRFGWPDWIATLVVILFVVGFPVTMFLAWVFDWTRTGIRRTEPWTAAGGLSIGLAGVFLIAGSAGLFWLINPSGVVRLEQAGVAVLPCRYQGDPEFRFRGEGFAGVLQESLARSPMLFVPEFDSVLDLAADGLSTGRLADSLHVSWLVECRVVQDQGRLRLEAGLIDAGSDKREELANLDLEALEAMSGLDTVYQAIVTRLGLGTDGEGRASPSECFPASLRALDAYMTGEQAYRTGTVEGIQKARELFRQAQLVPGFGLARAREADALISLIEINPPASEASLTASLQAVHLMLEELDRSEDAPAELYVAHLRFAKLSDRFGFGVSASTEQRREWFDRALALKPNDAAPYRLFAGYLDSIGAPGEAAAFRENAALLMPVGMAGRP
jgi:TolB-like protein